MKRVENWFCWMLLGLLCLDFKTPQLTQPESVTKGLAVTMSVVCSKVVCISVCMCMYVRVLVCVCE